MHHLRFRLWIAELNFYINVLRIYNDYLDEQKEIKDEKVEKKIAYFKNSFEDFRKEIDDLKHEMHLCKMALAASLKESEYVHAEKCETEKYDQLENQFALLNKKYEALKQEYIQFEQTLL